jgi:hypothetical protein
MFSVDVGSVDLNVKTLPHSTVDLNSIGLDKKTKDMRSGRV